MGYNIVEWEYSSMRVLTMSHAKNHAIVTSRRLTDHYANGEVATRHDDSGGAVAT